MNSQLGLNLSNNKINSIIKINEKNNEVDSEVDSEDNNKENNEELKLQLGDLNLKNKQLQSNTNELHNYDMLELTKKLEQNFREKHGNEHKYDKNLEFHIHNSINKFVKHDLKIKNTFNIFKPFKRLFSFKI
jgi:hypothetical protein